MNDRKQIFGWAMYDWANSAYVTTVGVAVLPFYFASTVVPEGGFTIAGTLYSATTLWGFVLSASAFFVFIFAPVLGAISDFSASKKKFLMTFAYGGSLCAVLLFFSRSGDVWLTIILFFLAQIGFVAANVFYDAFLPQIASEDKLDWVSGKGYAYGYVGGGLQFALSLGLIAGHEAVGITQQLAARIAIATAAMWWAGFSIVTFLKLKEEEAAERIPAEYRRKPTWLSYGRIGFKRIVTTAKRVRRFKHLLLFLVAYMIYNDGIQTVILMATIYGKEELGFSFNVLMFTLLIIQVVAIGGALLFGKLGEKFGTKTALMVTLVLWSFIVIYAYFLKTPTEYFILGAVVGLVMPGSQSLSRSLYGSIIPVDASAEFFGFYSVFNKFSAVWGPLAFALIRHTTGSSRMAILSVIVFFIVGLVMLFFVDMEKAREAKKSELFSAQSSAA